MKGHELHLASIPGVAAILAAKITAHSDDMERLCNHCEIPPVCRYRRLEKASGKTKRAVQNHKGNRALNNTFYLAAVSQITHNPKARKYYLKKQSEGKTKKHALRCVMKRIAMIVYGMLRNGMQYDSDFRKRQMVDIPGSMASHQAGHLSHLA